MATRKPAAKSSSSKAKPSRTRAMSISGPRRSKADKAASKPAKAKAAAKPKGKALKASAAKAPAVKSSGAAATARGRKKSPPAPNMQERMEGLQGWMAEIERKQERTTKLGGAAAVLAVLASGGAIALGVINQQNSATETDVDDLTEQVNELGTSVKEQTEKGLKSANTRLDALDAKITGLETQQATITQDIATLKSQQAAAAAAKGTGTGAGTGLGAGRTPANP
jgi:archaellum component FlaC